MRLLAIGVALCLWAGPSTAMQFEATEVAFAYRSHHAVTGVPTMEAVALLSLTDSATDPDRPHELIPSIPAAPRRYSRHELCSAAASVAAANNLPIPFFANLIQQESAWRPAAISPVGAQGIAQFMPRVARHHGLQNPFDPIHALAVSGRFLADLVRQFGNLGLAAAAYNAGPKRVQDWMAKRGKLPTETRDYVRHITGYPAEQWANARATGLRLPAYARCPDDATLQAQAIERLKPDVKIVLVNTKAAKKPAKASVVLASVPVGKKAALLPTKATRAALKSVPQIMVPEKQVVRTKRTASAQAVKPHAAVPHGPRKPLNLQPVVAKAGAPAKTVVHKAPAKPTTKLAAAKPPKRIAIARR